MGSSNVHTRANLGTPPNFATVRVNRRFPSDIETVDTETPLPTCKLAGDYDLLKPLGRGGMGMVYLARQRGLKRKVAYKVLTHLGCLDPETLGRFQCEAETLAKLQHTGIVQVFDSGSTNDTPYLAMEFVAGGSLADRLRAGRMDARAAAAILATVAGAVGYAHASGIIHRDLKPANILLTADGRPKVADFGLARDLACAGVTRTGFIAGTPAYMSPEQLAGRRDLGPPVDIWALGVMLYELLAGTVPFAGDDPGQILANILRHDPVSLRRWQPHLPRDLETICLKCLRKEPHKRYANGGELADDLLRFLDGQSIMARPVGPIERTVRWTRRNPLASGLLATTAVVMVAATSISLAFASREREQRRVAEAHAGREQTARAAELKLREEAERSAAAEKQARLKTENLTRMLEELLQGIRPSEKPYAALVENMKGIVQRLDEDDGDTRVRARLYRTLAMTHRNLGDFSTAARLHVRAHALIRERLGPSHPDVLASARDVSYTLYHDDRNAEAIAMLKPVIEAASAVEPADSQHLFELLSLLNMYYSSADRIEDEAKLGERLLAIQTKRYGADHEKTEWTRVNLRKYQPSYAKFADSIPVLRKAYGRMLATWGIDDDRTKWTRLTLGLSLLRSGQARAALPYLEPNYRAAIADKGFDHGHSQFASQFLAECFEACGRPADAVPIRRHMYDHYRSNGSTTVAAEQERHLKADLAAAKD